MRLGRHGTELAARTLATLIGNRYSRARPDAVTMAGKLGPAGASAAPALAGVLIAQDKNLRKTAAMALGKMGPAALSSPRRKDSPWREKLLTVNPAATATSGTAAMATAASNCPPRHSSPSDAPSSTIMKQLTPYDSRRWISARSSA